MAIINAFLSIWLGTFIVTLVISIINICSSYVKSECHVVVFKTLGAIQLRRNKWRSRLERADDWTSLPSAQVITTWQFMLMFYDCLWITFHLNKIFLIEISCVWKQMAIRQNDKRLVECLAINIHKKILRHRHVSPAIELHLCRFPDD